MCMLRSIRWKVNNNNIQHIQIRLDWNAENCSSIRERVRTYIIRYPEKTDSKLEGCLNSTRGFGR